MQNINLLYILSWFLALGSCVLYKFINKATLKNNRDTHKCVDGFLYYHFAGCADGTYPTTSNPYITVAYGAFPGYLLSDMFRKREIN